VVAALAVLVLFPVGWAHGQGIPPAVTVSGGVVGVGQTMPVSYVVDHDVGEGADGWAFGLCHPAANLQVVEVGIGADGSIANGGGEPDFVSLQIYSDGWTAGVVVNLVGAYQLPAGIGLEIGRATYLATAPGVGTICPCDTLGSPPVAVVMVYSGASLVPAQTCGAIEVLAGPVPQYLRGDANLDGVLDVADPIAALLYLFLGGAPPPCLAALDANSDGTSNVGDIVFVLSFLFVEGPAPAFPFPDCGLLPGDNCAAGSACP